MIQDRSKEYQELQIMIHISSNSHFGFPKTIADLVPVLTGCGLLVFPIRTPLNKAAWETLAFSKVAVCRVDWRGGFVLLFRKVAESVAKWRLIVPGTLPVVDTVLRCLCSSEIFSRLAFPRRVMFKATTIDARR
jgi:hypothetical protein